MKEQAGRAASYYPDTGCKEAPSCLDCPLPQCVHDSDRQEAQRRPPFPPEPYYSSPINRRVLSCSFL